MAYPVLFVAIAWDNTRFAMEDFEKAAYKFLILVCQTPVTLIYTLALGRQWDTA